VAKVRLRTSELVQPTGGAKPGADARKSVDEEQQHARTLESGAGRQPCTVWKTTGRRYRRLPFWKSSPALPDRIADRRPVQEIIRCGADFPREFCALFSRKLECEACTKSPDTRPKRGRLGSSSMLAQRR
jgi:hypothetical protein